MSRKNMQLRLGASMYVPLTQSVDAVVAIANGIKFPQLRSVIFDTEDSVREDQVALALSHLKDALPQFKLGVEIQRFVRVRTQHVMGRILTFEGVERLLGFVLPKVSVANLPFYLSNLSARDPFMLMPTLETAETFDKNEMIALRNMLIEDARLHERILCLRIGGNDLLSCLRLRRNPRCTIYDTAVGQVIAMLCGVFLPHHIGLSAPVCELMNNSAVLQRELVKDLDHGLFGKTAIHPTQIAVIESSYMVDRQDYNEAIQILDENAPAVFKMELQDGSERMCEPTTHSNWAEDIVQRANIYGIREHAQDEVFNGHGGNVVSLHEARVAS